MDIQEIWRNEMSSCCSMLIWDLHEKLLACKEKGMTTEICILPNYPASPRNEVLFDCVNLYVQSTASGEIEVRGILWDSYSKNGAGKQQTLIRVFNDIDSCEKWLQDNHPAAEECTEVFFRLSFSDPK